MEIKKVVYNVSNGQPFLVYANEEGENVYPEFEYTDVAIPDGLYQPIYFDVSQNKWIGSTKEEFEQSLPKETGVNKDLLIGQLTAQVATQGGQIVGLQKTIGELTMQIAQLQGGTRV